MNMLTRAKVVTGVVVAVVLTGVSAMGYWLGRLAGG